jgi:5-methylcytosine-specific restriction enzyme subunit McrC
MSHIIYISEHFDNTLLQNVPDHLKLVLTNPPYARAFQYKQEMLCFRLGYNKEQFTADSNYFVGIDWLVPGKAAIYVEPKLNDQLQVDYLGMLLNSLEAEENHRHLEGLFHVDYDQPWITIPEQKDRLSMILIIQFLTTVHHIVTKGLKNSYYRITENLNSRIKGKILVGRQIKENVSRNRLTKTVCNYQEHGLNTRENQFLKLVLQFVSSYLNRKRHFFNSKQHRQLCDMLNYCLSAFFHVDTLKQMHVPVHITKNIFYREYERAIQIGNYILRRFSFNLNKAGSSQTTTPPFWIDMSKLFELYVFGKIKKHFAAPGAVTYQDSFAGGKATDILIRHEGYKCVIDCKYKPRLINQSPDLSDKRQLAGYTRLKSVYKQLGMTYQTVIPGVIIYSHQECNPEIAPEMLFDKENRIEEYIDFYKVGISLPVLKNYG